MISFIVPAHNEQACLGRTLQAIHDAARVVGQSYEVIVVDDASTDSTARIARENNAALLPVNHRQIAATRNSGGRAARGELLFFVDADTIINPRVLASAIQAMDTGAAGGGALARFNGAPLYAELLLWWLGLFMRLVGLTGGAFMFCRRDAFHAAGGFDERLFGAEDAAMSWALKREGRFAVVWPTVITSGRRMRGIHGPRMIAGLIRMAFFPKMLTRRAHVQKIWYESEREAVENVPDSLAVRFFNGLMLLVTAAMLSGPLWNFIPWSLTPVASVMGKTRLGLAIFSCHIALVLWPCSYFLLRYLLRQTRWSERLKLLALLALSLWMALGATPVVIWFWRSVFGWVTHFFSH